MYHVILYRYFSCLQEYNERYTLFAMENFAVDYGMLPE